MNKFIILCINPKIGSYNIWKCELKWCDTIYIYYKSNVNPLF